ncbi:hypothetical protein [Rufibacter sp. XAAS-G3-1]|uniref:hypothetical protein n=1 Tax=Rufibacter sp. XAAS-G3-1 TaxID=2729134 RepID=UPI0015E698D2|nr:hypothetical protein [Rufibacter sp. XAAS-G3-1]
MQIAANTVVSIRYKMQKSKGEILENILEGSPVEYLHGAGNILPALEADLVGLGAEDTKQVYLSRDAGFTEMDDDFSFDVVIDAVREATEEEITNGYPHEEIEIEDCGPDCHCQQKPFRISQSLGQMSS